MMNNRRMILLCTLAVAAMLLTGCSNREQQKAESGKAEPKESASAAVEKRTRVRAQRSEKEQKSPSLVTTQKEKQSSTGETTASQTTTTASLQKGDVLPPSPVQEALAEIEKIPIQMVDHVTTPQVDQVRAAINNLPDKYSVAKMIRSDRQEEELLEKLNQMDQLAQKMLEAKSREELQETYRQLTEGLRLMDAEIQERLRGEQKPPQP
jgi:hypothetical protein